MRFSRRHRYGATPPSQRSYTYAIHACRVTGDLDTALELLRQASRDDSLELNTLMYSATIWVCKRCNRPDVALELLNEMKQKSSSCKPDESSYTGVIITLCQAGDVAQAVKIYNELKQSRIRGRESIYLQLSSAIKQLPSSDQQLAFLELIVNRFDPYEFRTKMGGPILESLIFAYAMDGRIEDALSLFDRIVGPKNGSCLRAILAACSKAQPPRWKETLSILSESGVMDDSSKRPAAVDMRAIGFTIIACSKSGEWEEAMKLLELHGRHHSADQGNPDNRSILPASAMNSLMTALGRGGRRDLVIKLLNEMEIKYGVRPDNITYRTAIISCNQAEHEKQRMIKLGVGQDSSDIESGSLQWWECALSLLRRMQESGLKADPQTFSSVISACEAAGKWQRALFVLRAMLQEDEKNVNLFCYNAAISACEKGGAWVEALELYYKMVEKGGPITPNFVTFNCVLIALENAGQKEVAHDLYEQGKRQNIIRPWRKTRDTSSGRMIHALDLHCCSSAMAKSAIRSVLESILSGSDEPDADEPDADMDGLDVDETYVDETYVDETYMDETYDELDAETFNYPPQVHDLSHNLVVIVGKGRGSEAEPVLLPAVQQVLRDDYGIESSIDPANSGRIIVSAQELQRFVAGMSWCEI